MPNGRSSRAWGVVLVVHGAVKALFQLIGVLIVGLLVLLPALFWRLSAGPIALDFLTPYIQDALSGGDSGVSVRLDGTVLVLGRHRWTIELRALNVATYVGNAARPVALVPEVAVALSGKALLNGQLAINSVTLLRPRLHLVREADGGLALEIGALSEAEGGTGSGADKVTALLLEALAAEPDPARPAGALQRIVVADAQLLVDDQRLNTAWSAHDTDMELRRVAGGLEASLHLEMDLAGESALADASLQYRRDGQALTGEATVSGIRPATLARLGGPLTPLRALDLPLAGQVRVKGDLSGHLDEVAFELAGGQGFFDLSAPVALHRRVESVALRGVAVNRMQRLNLEELSIDFGGPRLVLAGIADGIGAGGTSLNLDATLHDVPFAQLPELWPAFAAPNPREWVLRNMTKGVAREARLTLAAHSPSGDFDDLVVDRLAGEMSGDGIQVDYLHPMPVVKNAAAIATFDTQAFRVAIRGGEVYGLRVREGSVVLGGLSARDQFADIDLTVAGPVQDALRLVDSKPLRYASALGIDPAVAGGEATTRLRLKFPLIQALRLEDLDVKVHSSVKKVSLPQVALGLDLAEGDLELDVDTKGLDAVGPVRLGGIAGDLKWRENFSTKGVAYRSRYELRAPAIDEGQRRLLRLEGPPFIAPYLSGPVAAQVVATLQGGGRGEVEARIDLAAARVRLPGLGWSKQPGTAGGAEIALHLENNEISAIRRFAVTAGDLRAQGSVAFEAGQPRKVEVQRLTYGGRTDLSGTLGLRPGGGLDLVVRGDQFNAQPVVGDEEPQPGDPPPRPKGEGTRARSSQPPMTVDATVKTLWLSKAGALTGVSAQMQRDGDDWRQMNIRGGLGQGHGIAVSLRQTAPGRRSLKVTSDDAGALLKAFDTYGHMVAGQLEVEAVYEDDKDGQPLTGTIRVRDYYIVNAPALARLLTVAALTGILDILQDQGVSFSTLEVPFTLKDGLMNVRDARAYGPALGLTAKGEVDLDAKRMAMEGTVVPAYALNSFLGEIPLLGWLITGGEKGGGLVAFNYSMRGALEDPDVMVNPLSALTPGFLRRLFNIFDDGSETEARKKSPAR